MAIKNKRIEKSRNIGSDMPLKSRKKTVRLKRSPRKVIAIYSAIILFGIVGALGVFTTNAYNSSPGDIYVESPESTKSHPVGEVFSLTVYGHVKDPGDGSTRVRLDLSWTADAGQVEFISCMPLAGGGCNNGTGHPSQGSPSSRDFRGCVEFSSADFGKKIPLYTVTYKSRFDGAYRLGYYASWDSQSCSSPESGVSLVSSGIQYGTCGHSGIDCSGYGGGSSLPAPTDPGGSGQIDPGNGENSVNEGAQNGTESPAGQNPGYNPGESSSQSGDPRQPNSSANSAPQNSTQSPKRTNAPTVPSNNSGPNPVASAVGTSPVQALLAATPFYDGREYARGLIRDEIQNGEISVLNTRIQKWYVFIAIFVAVIIAIIITTVMLLRANTTKELRKKYPNYY